MTDTAAPQYLIDTCAIMDLQGYNSNTGASTDDTTKERLWQGLETLIDEGRVMTVREVRDELKRRCTACYKRLTPRMSRFVKQSDADIMIVAGDILDKHPSLVKDLDRRIGSCT